VVGVTAPQIRSAATLHADEVREVLALADRVYDRRAELTADKRDALEALHASWGGRWPRRLVGELSR